MIALLITALICGTVIYVTERVLSVKVKQNQPVTPPQADQLPIPQSDQPDQPDKPSEREAREAMFQDIAATVSTLLRGEVDFDELRS